jgi:indolepyruvate ferredoxin oxidoreductase
MTPAEMLLRERAAKENTDLPALPAIGREVTLDDKYGLDEGLVFMSGIQALVRLLLEQMRADQRRGLNTATMVSGYQGSPLGGFDKELARQRKARAELNIEHQPALNEELGATTVWGSQMAPLLPRATKEGVLGVWYGKAPGVDRAADALRHGNFAGAHPKGGMLALCGDDPSCKSSTLPSATEATLASFKMPVVYPGNVQEVIDLGLHAIAASRASGLWVGLKIATNVADAVGTVMVSPDRIQPVMPENVLYNGVPYVHTPSANLLAPDSLELERTLHGPRLDLAVAYARANRINRIAVNPRDAWLGIVASGTTYYDLREACLAMGLTDAVLERAGVRILKLGMLYPLEPSVVREFAEGLDEVVVLEEKGPFVESAIKDLLYDAPSRPRILGKRDEQGRPLVPVDGALDADIISHVVGHRVLNRVQLDSIEGRLRKLAEQPPKPLEGPKRTPFFCSGCPHNRSTDAPEDSSVGLGIGCHTMVLLNQTGKGKVTGLTQMGGEGAQWIGQAPFTETPHLFQNLGDGTFHHSGSLAIRAAVASGVNITYKLLYNGTVAMTGAQEVEGQIGVPDLTRWLEIEGVKKIIVTTDEPEKYEGVELSKIATVRHRNDLMVVQKELRKVEGVTVMVHDQGCAAEKRRLRKRGKLEDPPQRVHINERVCEGCGDCGQKSDCLSVLPVETEFGRKTQIHQASCNKDYSCVDGDCPSFLTVVPGKAKAKKQFPTVGIELPLPKSGLDRDEATLRMIGIGGTGVVTVSQIVGMAALLDGKRTAGLDQTGLAQKGGQVISDVRIFNDAAERSNKATEGGVDGYLAFDLLGATTPVNLATADPEKTVAVVSTSQVPTGSMVVDTTVRFAELNAQLDAIEARTLREDNVYIDAQSLSEALFEDHMPTNAIVLGAAWQKGLIPISLSAIEEAFRLNGAGVEKNIAAFHWGRAAVVAPDLVEEATREELPQREVSPVAKEIVATIGAEAGSELEQLLEVRVTELIAHTDRKCAEKYAAFVKDVLEAERTRTGTGRTRVSEAVAKHLYKLMAYKDEYEVARLHLDPVERAKIEAEFGKGAKVKYNLHPPVLRALGMKRKLKLGRWFDPFFRVLRALKFLRGSKLDIFGYAKVRKVERALIGEYRELVEETLPKLDADSYDTVVELFELPDVIRGYEEIKLGNVERWRAQVEAVQAKLDAPAGASPLVVTKH